MHQSPSKPSPFNRKGLQSHGRTRRKTRSPKKGKPSGTIRAPSDGSSSKEDSHPRPSRLLKGESWGILVWGELVNGLKETQEALLKPIRWVKILPRKRNKGSVGRIKICAEGRHFKGKTLGRYERDTRGHNKNTKKKKKKKKQKKRKNHGVHMLAPKKKT